MKQFWNSHKVFILGLLGSIAVALEPFINNTEDELKWKIVGFAALMAALSYLAKEWRGQTISILGILGNLAVSICNGTANRAVYMESVYIASRCSVYCRGYRRRQKPGV